MNIVKAIKEIVSKIKLFREKTVRCEVFGYCLLKQSFGEPAVWLKLSMPYRTLALKDKGDTYLLGITRVVPRGMNAPSLFFLVRGLFLYKVNTAILYIVNELNYTEENCL